MGGIELNDRAVGLLSQYDIDVIRTRKGRGAILCDTEKGCFIFKEYTGNPEKLLLQDCLLKKVSASGSVQAELLIPTREGALWVEDGDGRRYFLKTYFDNRECDLSQEKECREAVRTLAKLHNALRLAPKEVETFGLTPFLIDREYEKHNKELRKVWRYLRKKSQKSLFESALLREYDYYLEQAAEVTEAWRDFTRADDLEYIRECGSICHGDYQYHNIIRTGEEFAVINFERCIMDDGIRDLCFFMRKLLEKNDWSPALGDGLLEAYGSIRPISARSFVELYYRLAYPEKFWKIANFYYNSGKAWIPERNQEKLEILAAQEKAKQEFLEKVFRTLS